MVTPTLQDFTNFSNRMREEKFRTSLERLSSIPGRCIIPEGIYASDFSPNCFEIPHSSWPRHTRDDIKLVIVVVSISASGRGDDRGFQLCPEFPDICSFCRCWRECVDVLRDVDTKLLTGVLVCWSVDTMLTVSSLLSLTRPCPGCPLCLEN